MKKVVHGPYGCGESDNLLIDKANTNILTADITADINIKKVKTVMHGPFRSEESDNRWFHKTDTNKLTADITADINIKNKKSEKSYAWTIRKCRNWQSID